MGDAVRPVWYRRIVQPMGFLVLCEALSFASNTLADAAEAGARATESWGAVA